ncbi:MAG: flagellar basal body L-ring protein FlgH [Acidobacteriota bacterium]
MTRALFALGVAAVLAGAAPALAQAGRTNATAEKPPKAVDNYDELYHRYLRAARLTDADAAPPARNDWMISLAADPRARRVNDLLTVQVVEVIAASGTADSSLNKESSGAASLTSFFGLEDKFPGWLDPTSLAGASSATDFKGGGVTNRTGQLTAMMTVRVAEVLPNGDLVLEGAREIDINGDRQIVVLTGVVRPVDVPQTNVVSSTRIGQLRIRYFGRGLIKDNLQPGWLVRILNKIF